MSLFRNDLKVTFLVCFISIANSHFANAGNCFSSSHLDHQRPPTAGRGALSRPLLPPPPQSAESQRRVTLVFDLDETLVYSSKNKIPGGSPTRPLDGRRRIAFRPYLHWFLDEAKSMGFEVVVFSAGTANYVEKVVNQIDPKRELISYVLCRDHCAHDGTFFVKDLARLGRDLNRTVIFDDRRISFSRQISNGVKVRKFTGDSSDQDLLTWHAILKALSQLNQPGAQGSVYSVLRDYYSNLTRP